ncbi:unnamed protein product [Somion occarium]|uniref:Afadin and alpha-actinin-binding-domain-containing protein n=1 Tax=Somion occarium TaxID=3059160 RepID=A0ABP1E287_9APHY
MTSNKLVHWALEASLSDFGSPFTEGDSSDSITSSSSLQYVNSQLLAHGFTHGTGLSLDGLGKEDTEKVVKCLLGMLSQRIDDMSRTEELTTKLRTLSYEHERLASLLKTANDRAANAEREMNLHKSRLASANQTLQTTETAHKRTTAELQRTRSSLQALRTTHQAEIKKMEKEKDRMMEKWNKLADNQLKAGSVACGIKFANSQVVEASDVQLRAKGQGFLEVSLEQAEQSRSQLADEVRSLRGIVISTANELQRILHIARNLSSSEVQEEPPTLTLTALFPLSPANTASEKLSSLLSSTKDLIDRLARSHATLMQSTSAQPQPASSNKPKEQSDQKELDRLNAIIDTLRKELKSSTYASQAQALFDRFSQDPRLLHGHDNPADISVDLMIAPRRDEEQDRLDKRNQDLDEERRKFTEAAVRLGKEKAALEAERLKFLEEKRSWQVEMMLADLPPTPGPSSVYTAPVEYQHVPTPEIQLPVMQVPRSPRRSPRKAKAGSSKKTRISRRSSGVGSLSPRKSKVVPAFETEVISKPVVPQFSISLATSQGPTAIASPFVLPPPSPAASIKQADALLSSALPPLPKLDIPPNPTNIPYSQSDTALQAPEPVASSSTIPASSSEPSFPVSQLLTTPRPFPLAKPFAQRMIHAYSPVKPSPLSRILMMASSPDSPESSTDPALQAVSEENESLPDVSPTPVIGLGPPPQKRKAPMPSLAAELGLEDSDEDNPLLDKPTEKTKSKDKKIAIGHTRLTAKDKGKARADHIGSRARGVAVENKIKRMKMSSGTSSSGAPSTSRVASGGIVKKTTKSVTRGSVAVNTTAPTVPPQAKFVGKAKSGPRRVPINSAEAAPVPKSWKG